MKHQFRALLCIVFLLAAIPAQAVYVQKMPVNQIQPSGDTVHFFVTGDECYHRYHDADNYTIVQDPAGYWVYAIPAPGGSIQPSPYRVGSVSPATLGILPGIQISRQEWQQRRSAWEIPEKYRVNLPKTSGRNHGDFCNLVIFIRFADDTAYSRTLSSIDQMWSDSSSVRSSSVYNYFKTVSYNKIFVRTYYAPSPDSNTIRSYQSPHPRAYYMPYNDNNPIGYSDYSERTEREFDLLVGAVNYLNDSAPVPSDYVLDCDNDGYIDNVNFVVKGSYTGWSDLLWPHKWNLYGHDVFINGKQVSTFNFALEGSGSDYFGPSTFCHEMFHSLGAPDLYRYNTGTEVSPVGSWDLMASNSKPPQHMSAYMKYKYGNWLDSIPLITTPGVYTLSSVGDSTPGNIIYRFPSADPNQFYIVEYRDKNENFERTLPGSGLLIYRIDTRFNGNAGYNGEDNFDEIWLFRPGSSNSNTSGYISEASFSSSAHRTEFSPSSDPFPYLSDGTRDFTFAITNIGFPGNTISFRYTNRTCPADLINYHTTTSTATLIWKGAADAYRLKYRKLDSNDPYTYLTIRSTRTIVTGLESNCQYEWSVNSLYEPLGNDQFADSTAYANSTIFHTQSCNNSTTDTIGSSTIESRTGITFASNNNYNYSQQLFLASELSGEKIISSISFHYAHTTPLEKENCSIYLAHTSLANFNDSTPVLPLSQLSLVYTGTLRFELGWNDFILDTPFHYNGTNNLLLALDDNSGAPSFAAQKFYLNNTNDFMSFNYHSEDKNPGPEQDSIEGTLSRNMYRNNILFEGCPVTPGQFYACVLSNNDALGSVSGGGLYPSNQTIRIYAYPSSGNQFVSWNDGVEDNPRSLVLTQDTLFFAFFHSPVGIDDAGQALGYIISTQQLQLTIQGAARQPVIIYDIMGRPIAKCQAQPIDRLTFDLPHSGIYLVRIGNEKPVKIFVR